MMIFNNFEGKAEAAYQHGRMDFLAGAPRDPKIPPGFCNGLNGEQKKLLKESWIQGWMYECVTQSLSDGLPA